MSRRLLTLRGDKVLTALWEDGRIIECSADIRQPAFLNRIYVARVEHIVHNIGGAFLSAGNQKLYYSLKDNFLPLFTVSQRPGCITEGDEIVVQVTREALKTKEACAGSALQIGGRYCVVFLEPKPRLSVRFSRKITEAEWRSEMAERVSALPCTEVLRSEAEKRGFGISILIRTNAAEVGADQVEAEIGSCCESLGNVLRTAAYRSTGSCLWQPMPAYISAIRDTALKNLEAIVSDQEELLCEVREALETARCSEGLQFTLYQDDAYPMSKCYNLDASLEKALRRQVWLSSGAYLVIEQTEALTAIDVNTGKAIAAGRRKESQDDYFYRINLEAAKEILYQLRLRNLSGMILVDFISMKDPLLEQELMKQLELLARKDPLPTRIVDMTQLGLVEITRKKLREPLEKQLQGSFGED